jgi:hypothetical protein
VLFIHHANFEVRVGQSLANPREADIIMQLVQDQRAAGRALEDIGIISAYLAQANLLAQKARTIFGDEAAKLEIHTVDGFQGRDKPTIIISTVRSNSNAAIGFLKDERRLNVALTRAEDRLFVVGNRNTLGYVNPWTRQGHIFSKYVDWAAKVSKPISVFSRSSRHYHTDACLAGSARTISSATGTSPRQLNQALAVTAPRTCLRRVEPLIIYPRCTTPLASSHSCQFRTVASHLQSRRP